LSDDDPAEPLEARGPTAQWRIANRVMDPAEDRAFSPQRLHAGLDVFIGMDEALVNGLNVAQAFVASLVRDFDARVVPD